MSTSTLASSQLSYAAVTITAGAVKLETGKWGAESTTTTTSSSAGAAVVTAGVDLRWIGAALGVGVGAVVAVL